MSLAEYEELLADLIARDKLMLEQAQQLRQMFMNGEIREDDLPLPLERAREKDKTNILLFNAFPAFTVAVNTFNKKYDRDRIMQSFESMVTESSVNLSDGEISVNRWHTLSAITVYSAMYANWLAGNGTDAEPNIDAMIDEQLTYLYRFAGEQSTMSLLGTPFSEQDTVRRLLLYGGAVRAAWFMGNESYNYGDGYVAHYIPKDTMRTCLPCHQARGYYRVGEGPMPGDVCLGGVRCQCERIVVYAPEILARL